MSIGVGAAALHRQLLSQLGACESHPKVGVEKMYWGTAFINERINLKALKLL